MSTLRRFFELPWSHRTAAVEAALILAGVRLYLALAGLPAALDALQRAARSGRGRVRGEPGPRDLARLVRAIGHRVMDRPCLAEALALKLLLDRDAQPSHLVIGARRMECGRLEVHAWLESEGEVLIGGPRAALDGLVPLFELPTTELLATDR